MNGEYIVFVSGGSSQFAGQVRVPIPDDLMEGFHHISASCLKEKITRCRDCEEAHPEPPSDRQSRKAYQGGYWCEYWSEGIGAWCPADGFCHAGKPRENPCRNADENAAAFADAPTLETAREPKQTPVFELGA